MDYKLVMKVEDSCCPKTGSRDCVVNCKTPRYECNADLWISLQGLANLVNVSCEYLDDEP